MSTPVENSPFRRSKNPHPKPPAGVGSSVSVLPPFPHLRNRPRNGPERSRARWFCAAQRTLDGEDRCETGGQEGKGRWPGFLLRSREQASLAPVLQAIALPADVDRCGMVNNRSRIVVAIIGSPKIEPQSP